jgi:hypothetical protein
MPRAVMVIMGARNPFESMSFNMYLVEGFTYLKNAQWHTARHSDERSIDLHHQMEPMSNYIVKTCNDLRDSLVSMM